MVILLIGGASIDMGGVDAFPCRVPSPYAPNYYTLHRRIRNRNTQLLFSNKQNDQSLWKGVVNLWDEIIEMSTYGPSERKMLKAQRERQKLKNEDIMMDMNTTDGTWDFENDKAWMEAFTAAKDNTDTNEIPSLEYDGYALQDLLLSKWGAPLDVDFQRIGSKIYCTVLPLLGYGSPLRSRHNTELDYLMHLQGVVEVLHKYDNLEDFIAFVETTEKVPKRGTDSVPFRLNLSRDIIDKIIS